MKRGALKIMHFSKVNNFNASLIVPNMFSTRVKEMFGDHDSGTYHQ
jgi:hypothetical protein